MASLLPTRNISVLALILYFTSVPSFAADFVANGDGSATNNPDLLRGSYETGCYYPAICGGLLVAPASNVSIITNQKPVVAINNQRPLIANRPASAPLSLGGNPLDIGVADYRADVFSPATTFDWSVNLRGAYIKDYKGERFETILTPRASVSHKNRNAQYNFGAEASLTKPSDSEFAIENANVNADGTIIIDRDSVFSFDSNVQIQKESVNSLSLANNIIDNPSILNINTNATLLRRFGKLTGELRAGYIREFYSNTGLIGGLWQDNSARNRNSYSAGLRLTQEITPIISAYGDVSALRNIYDTAPSAPNAIQNNWDFVARGGFSGNWGNVLMADISAGYALRNYDANTLSDSPTFIIDANASYDLGRGADVSANFSTDISTPEPTSGATKRIGYSLSAIANYQVNDWLKARAVAGGNWASFEGIADIERTYNVGLGMDYALNRHTKLAGDYTYSLFEPTPANKRDSHRIEFGITYSR